MAPCKADAKLLILLARHILGRRLHTMTTTSAGTVYCFSALLMHCRIHDLLPTDCNMHNTAQFVVNARDKRHEHATFILNPYLLLCV